MKEIFIKCIFIILVLIITLSPGFSPAQMYWNQACYFAGSYSSYLSKESSSSLDITGSFTIQMWINPVNSTSPVSQALVQKREGSNPSGYTLYLVNGRVAIRTNSGTRFISKTVLTNNSWTHITGRYDASTGEFSTSINGVIDTSAIVPGSSPISNGDSLYIGKGFNTPFEGQLDEIRIWNKVITPEQVFVYRRTSLGTSSGRYSGLVLSLTFQDNDGEGEKFSLVDWSGNNNNFDNHSATPVDLSNRPLQTININESVELDGIADYISGPDNATFSPQNVFTLEAWIYPRSSIGETILIHKGTSNGATTNYSLRLYNRKIRTIVNNNIAMTSNDSVQLNQWSHVAFVYDANSGFSYLYLNGKLIEVDANNNIPITNGTDSIYIGGAPLLASFNGFIDEFRAKLSEKTEDEINRFLFQSIDESNDLSGTELVYNFDGYLTSNMTGITRLYFRNDSKFSGDHNAYTPMSPLLRHDNLNFSDGYYIQTSEKRIPATGTSGMIEDTLDVMLSETISDVNVFIAINHTSLEDLLITLFAPNGDNVDLSSSNALISGSHNFVTIFNDQADSSMLNGRYVSFAPVIKPYSNMNSVFSGDNSSGKWRLSINDLSVTDTGRLYGWGIQVNNKTSKQKLLSTKNLIQGFYNSTTNLTVADTMKVLLRHIETPYQVVDSAKGYMQQNSSTLFSFNNAQNGIFYYIEARHRNSVETWSSIPLQFNSLTSQAQYDFTNALINAFGNNMILIDNSPVEFAIYNGDQNQDGTVDATDIVNVYNDVVNFGSGYLASDMNGDNFTDVSDMIICHNNSTNFVSVIRP